MMQQFLTFFLVLSLSSLAALGIPGYYMKRESMRKRAQHAWGAFKIENGKKYTNAFEDKARFEAFLDNYALVEEANSDPGRSFKLTTNEYSDWMPQERQKLLGFIPERGDFKADASGKTETHANDRRDDKEYPDWSYFYQTKQESELPRHMNWTAFGAVTAVRHQGLCGSCWAFAAVGAMEDRFAEVTWISATFSEQYLVDCDTWNNGCGGGSTFMALQHVAKHGIPLLEVYPYTGLANSSCKYSKDGPPSDLNKGYVEGIKLIKSGDDGALLQALAEKGTVIVAMDVEEELFLYKSGVYRSATCSKESLNHAMLVVGYGTTLEGEKYWLVKNSWGRRWGINGYMMVSRDEPNMCGISTRPIFPERFVVA